MSESMNRTTKATRFSAWGDSLLNKLPGRSRRRRKREASKRRRAFLKRELEYRVELAVVQSG